MEGDIISKVQDIQYRCVTPSVWRRPIISMVEGMQYEPVNRQYGGECAPGGTPSLGHIRDVRPEWVTFPGREPADGCKFLTKNLRMGYNFDIILPENGWLSSKLNKTYCSLVNLY